MSVLACLKNNYQLFLVSVFFENGIIPFSKSNNTQCFYLVEIVFIVSGV
ncbi:hypothetical protein MNB_SUP05-SYMBIONT-4-727 [hydrothermal vent metagenome]|uniref:Uncharacterized protein n=1 Tax=hydrothermal vent metagenome TaxID=652676 RepID=A0A1W1DZG6_9ZZZZ